MSLDELSDAIHSKVVDTTKRWLRDPGGALMMEAMPQHNGELQRSLELARALRREVVINNRRKAFDQEPCEPQVNQGIRGRRKSGGSGNVQQATERFGRAPCWRGAGVANHARRCGVMRGSGAKKHDQHLTSLAERVTQLEVCIGEIGSAWKSHSQKKKRIICGRQLHVISSILAVAKSR